MKIESEVLKWLYKHRFQKKPIAFIDGKPISFKEFLNDVYNGIVYIEKNNLQNKLIGIPTAYNLGYQNMIYFFIFSIVCKKFVDIHFPNSKEEKVIQEYIEEIKKKGIEILLDRNSYSNKFKYDYIPEFFFKTLQPLKKINEIFKFLKQFSNNFALWGLRSGGTTGSFHITYHNLQELYIKVIQPLLKQKKENRCFLEKKYCLCLRDFFQAEFFIFKNKCSFHFFTNIDETIKDKEFLETYINKYKINSISSTPFITQNLDITNFKNTTFFSYRGVNQEFKEYMKKIIFNDRKNTFVEYFASTECTYFFFNIVERNNFEHLGEFNYFPYGKPKLSKEGTFQWTYYNPDNNDTEVDFFKELSNGNFKYLGRKKPIMENNFSLKRVNEN
ncbi:MAG: hypothetical protein LBF02_01935 [Mycoplasmataceae bacterium]|nr:hypothetical protein [Mycoplasmataceae bacterium]